MKLVINALQIHYALAFFNIIAMTMIIKRMGTSIRKIELRVQEQSLYCHKYLFAQQRDQKILHSMCYKGGNWGDRIIATISLRLSD